MPSYEQRKKDHIILSLKDRNRLGDNDLSRIQLIHEALPEINWSDVDLSCRILGQKRLHPFYVSSMTGGFQQSEDINFKIASVCAHRGWMMGVGSQRKQMNNPDSKKEWFNIKKKFPKLSLLGNLGLSQLIEMGVDQVQEFAESLGAHAMMIHTNPLQECLQFEGTPQFKNGKKLLSLLSKKLSIPVGLKETGCGFSESTLQSLCGLGLKVVDVSGYGGTHFGRIEGDRLEKNDIRKQAAQTYSLWGNTTLSSLLSARKCVNKDFEVWASGGLKNGLDSAKCLALGASSVGFANVILEAAIHGEEAIDQKMSLIEEELKVALFCTGSKTISDLRNQNKWKEIKI